MDPRILLKIKKLLSLAKSNNPFEAASALSKAQAMMRQHGIGMADVALSDCETRSLDFNKETLMVYEVRLLTIIQSAFGVQAIVGGLWKNGKYVSSVDFIGIAPQPELACYCLDVLYRQLHKSRAEYVATLSNKCKRMTKIKRGDDFAKGWVFEVHSKVQAFALTEQQQELVSQYKAGKYNNLTTAKGADRSKGKVRDQDLTKGMRAAKDVRLDRPIHGQETPKLTGACA